MRLGKSRFWPSSKSHISAALSELHEFFLVTLLLQLSIRYSLAMSRHLTVSEKKDMAETMEIQKCHFLCRESGIFGFMALFSDMVGISAMDQRKNLAIGLLLFPIPGLGIFQLNGAEIFDVENHKRKSLV